MQQPSVTTFGKHLPMNTVGDRIKAVRADLGMDRKELARRTGIGYSSIAEIERGGQKSTTKLPTYARALGVTSTWLETGKGPKHSTEAPADPDWSSVRGFKQAVGAGKSAEVNEWAETHKLKFRAESLAGQGLDPEQLAVYYADGDSMEPRLHTGDAVLFDRRDKRPRNKKLFVVQMGKELYVKRCRLMEDGGTYFDSLNEQGDHDWREPRRMDNPRRPIEILGRVRWIGSWEV